MSVFTSGKAKTAPSQTRPTRRRDSWFAWLKKPSPNLQVSEQLWLRVLEVPHTSTLFSLVETNRAFLQEWLSWIETIQTEKDCRKFIEGVRYRDVFAGTWVYGVWYQGELVGLLDLNEGNRHDKQVSIGYWLGKQVLGRGIMTMCVLRCMDHLFRQEKVQKILIKCASHNKRSEAIPLRLRFSWEGIEQDAGTLQGEEVAMHTYGMRATDWKDARALYLASLEG
ncbi:MAG: GNAT family N-acetyltransferase [Bacteroidota bacterium]